MIDPVERVPLLRHAGLPGEASVPAGSYAFSSVRSLRHIGFLVAEDVLVPRVARREVRLTPPPRSVRRPARCWSCAR